MKKRKNSLKQKMIINIINVVLLAVIVTALIINEKVSNENAENAAGLQAEAEDALSTGDYIAGIDSDIIKNDNGSEEDRPDDNQGIEMESPEVVSKEYNNVTSGKLIKTSYVKSDYFDNTIFLGDSRTVALEKHGFIKTENTFAINGISHIGFMSQEFTDTVTGITGDIFSIVNVRKPEKIYVALGANGVAYLSVSEFMKDYEKLIDKLMEASPDSKIIVQCVLPVNEATYTGENKNMNNANIDTINAELLKMAEKKEIFFLDISSDMKNADNQLMDAYDVGDGIHYSFTGCSVIYDGICRHGVD